MVTRKPERIPETREHMRGGAGVAVLTPASKQLPGNARLFPRSASRPVHPSAIMCTKMRREMFLFLEGEGRVMDDDVEVCVHPGDSMATFPGHGHSVENIGDTDLLLVAVIIKE